MEARGWLYVCRISIPSLYRYIISSTFGVSILLLQAGNYNPMIIHFDRYGPILLPAIMIDD